MNMVLNYLQYLGYILIFPGFLFCFVAGLLLCGIDRKLVARMQKRVGPPVLQPFYDFFKLCGKETIIPTAASKTTFLAAPIVGFAALVVIQLFIPIRGFTPFAVLGDIADVIVILYLLLIPAIATIMGGAASGSPYAGVGLSREMVTIISCELPLVLVLLAIGKTVGVVGESGCGKSVTSLSLMQLLQRPQGQVVEGEIRLNLGSKAYDVTKAPDSVMQHLRGNYISMIFQEPMTALNPVFRIGDQVDEVLALHNEKGHDEAQIKARTIELLEMVGIANSEGVYKMFPHELSGGMRQRVMIAMALANHPDLLIADEPTTALDVTIQHQILKQMRSLQEEYGTSIIFITHDLGVVAELCDRVVVLYGGLVMEEAEINDLFENPLHPYTMGLLASIPGLTKDKSERLQSIPGSPPDMTKPPKGCPFASRCQFARNICAAECPPFVQVGSRQARCWLLQPDAPAEGNPLHEKLAEAERKAH